MTRSYTPVLYCASFKPCQAGPSSTSSFLQRS
uniref:Uncharacterized protein n=1 Tax=Arundo donax TaxID=35708 RepID=A0A0A9ALR9_ARUDO